MEKDMNWLGWMWIAITIFVLAVGIPVVFLPNMVPEFVSQIFRIGKLKTKSPKVPQYLRKLLLFIELPKSCYKHFYLSAVAFYTFLVGVVFSAYFLQAVPQALVTFLNLVAGSHRKASVEPVAVIVVIVLLWCHAARRAYESQFVNVFSSATINVFQYILGMLFYPSVGTSLIAEAAGFTSTGFQELDDEEATWNWSQLLGTALYFWATWHQYKCNRIMADLRKNRNGRPVSTKYHIPKGDWFHYVSCPHYTAEILIYLSLNLILKLNNTLCLLLLAFVCSNQIIVGLLNHKWYLQKYKEYPQDRKAVLPFIL